MTWTAQVRQVLLKDLREQWKWPAALAATTVVSALRAVGHFPDLPQWDMIFSWIMAGIVLVSLLSILRADPPAQCTAFWSTQPLQPTAVATAKLSFAAVLLVPLVAGALFVVASWKLDPGQAALTVAHLAAAVFAVIAYALCITGLGSRTDGKPAAAPGLVMGIASIGYALISLNPAARRTVSGAVDSLPVMLWIPAVAGVTFTLFRVYRSRELSGGLQGLAVVMGLVPGILFLRDDPPPAPRVATVDTTVMRARALWTPAPEMRLSLAFTTRGNDAGRLRFLLDGRVTAILRDGSSVSVALRPQRLLRADGRIPSIQTTGAQMHVIGGQSTPRDSTIYAPTWISLLDVEKELRGDVERFIVEGTMADYDVREVDRFPLRTGDAPVRDGRLISVRITPQDTAGPLIGLRTRWLQTPDRHAPWSVPAPLWRSDLLFAAIDTVTRVQMPMRWKDIDYGEVRIALPGYGVAEMSHFLEPALWSVARPPITESWLAAAQLVVGTPVFHHSVRVRAEAVIVSQ